MAAAPDLTLWGVGTSRTIRPHWAMHELGLPYKTKPIGPRTGETKTAEYTKLNPRQKVPLLQDGDFCIGESAAIVAYLSRMYSTPQFALIPGSAARIRRLAGVVFLCRRGAGFDQPLRDAPPSGRRARPDLRRGARGRGQGRRIFPAPSCTTSRWRLRMAASS